MKKTENPRYNSRCCIFLPGWGSTPSLKSLYVPTLKTWSTFSDIYCLFKPRLGISHSIPELSEIAATYITNANLHTSYDFLTIIGYSMGGLVAIDMLQNNEEILENTDALVTIATPIAGTPSAKAAGLFSRSARDMRPNSQFLQDLHQNMSKIENIQKMSVGAAYDVLVPHLNTVLDPWNHVKIPHREHISVLRSKRTRDEIWAWLTYKVLGEVGHSDCLAPVLRFVELGKELA